LKNVFLNIYNGLFKNPDDVDNLSSGFNSNLSFGLLDYDKKKLLEHYLNIKIKNIAIFEQALIHRSYLQVINNSDIKSNERLEFFGDAILGFIITEYLLFNYQDEFEGKLTKIRSWLVNKHSLAICAKKLNLSQFIFMSHSAEQSLKIGSESILADTMEAIIAAIYIDSGLEITKQFVINKLLSIMLNEKLLEDKNYKSRLLEIVQSLGFTAPRYETLEELGPDHSKEFKAGVYVNNILKGIGTGKSKKEAEQNAAKIALKEFINN